MRNDCARCQQARHGRIIFDSAQPRGLKGQIEIAHDEGNLPYRSE
jgi:hypothetical protein